MATTYQQDGRTGERGNVLFLILIAVALFAALSYAVTQSSRSGGGDASSEKSLVSSSQLTQYPAGIRTSIVRMIVSNGISVDELLFDPPSSFATSFEGSAPNIALQKQAVFYPTGGGATAANAPADMMLASGSNTGGVWVYSSKYQVKNIGITDASSNAGNDIIAFLSGVNKSVCVKIDQQLGIPATSDAPAGELAAAVPAADQMDTGVSPSVGTPGIPAGAPTAIIGSTHPEFLGQPFGCMKATNGTYVYYHVLVER